MKKWNEIPTFTKVLITGAIVFLGWASVVQFRDIQRLRTQEREHPELKKPEMYVGPDGRLVTPPLRSKPTVSDMNNCMACKIHKNK